MTRRDRLALTVLLGLVVGLDPLSIDVALPAARVMAEGLATDLASVQLGVSLFVLGMAAGQLFHGPASDRFGRRPVMLGALCLYVLASAAVALAPGIDGLLAARLVQGFAAAATQTVSRAIIRDRLDREAASQVLSYVFLVLAIAPIVGPLAGAALMEASGWRALFWLMAAYGAIALTVHGRWLKETNDRPDAGALDPMRMVRSFAAVASDRRFWAYVGCGASAFAGLFAFLIGSPSALIVQIGLDPGDFAVAFALVMAGNLLGYPAGARLVGRLGLDRLLAVGVLGATVPALALLGLALAGVDAAWAVVAPGAAYMFCFAVLLPPAMAGALSPFPRIAGAASSVLGFVQLGTGAATGAIVGALDDGTRMPMAVAIAVAALVGVLALLAVRAVNRSGAAT